MKLFNIVYNKKKLFTTKELETLFREDMLKNLFPLSNRIIAEFNKRKQ